MPILYYILVCLYFDAAIICCRLCMFYFSIYGGAINNNNSGVQSNCDAEKVFEFLESITISNIQLPLWKRSVS